MNIIIKMVWMETKEGEEGDKYRERKRRLVTFKSGLINFNLLVWGS